MSRAATAAEQAAACAAIARVNKSPMRQTRTTFMSPASPGFSDIGECTRAKRDRNKAAQKGMSVEGHFRRNDDVRQESGVPPIASELGRRNISQPQLHSICREKPRVSAAWRSAF